MVFFNPTNTRKGIINWFFIPILEQIKENDYDKARSWKLAESSRIRRQFYTSTECLLQFELPRIPTNKQLSCYKVILKDSDLAAQQLQPFKGERTGFAAFLSISPEQIESLIVFKGGERLEFPNPFYAETTNIATANYS